MRYGLDISPAGPWGRPERIAALAALAEDAGWDGVFCEDYVSFPGDGDLLDTYDTWTTLALVAHATTRLILGTMVTPLPRRRPQTVAAQAMTVDQISGGRLILGVGIGDDEPANFAAFGETSDLKRRGDLLDEGLEVVSRLWSGEPVTFDGEHYHLDGAVLRPRPVARPRIPIWVGGALTMPRPRRRALRWDGACLYRILSQDGWQDVGADDVRRLRVDADARPSGGSGYVIAVGGRERGPDETEERRYVASLAAAGADWWHEYVPPRLPYDEARRRIESGPLRAAGA